MTKQSYEGIIPIQDMVFVKRKKANDKTSGGLVLPDQAREHPLIGEVVAVGPGALRFVPATASVCLNQDTGEILSRETSDRYPMQCRVGNKVLMPPNVMEILLNPDDKESGVCYCHENQLLAILT